MSSVAGIVDASKTLLRVVVGEQADILANVGAGESVIFAPDFDPAANPDVDYMPLLVAAGVVIPPPPPRPPIVESANPPDVVEA